MKVYADTNFFVCSFVDLPGSDIAEALLTRAKKSNAVALPVTWLHRVEYTNALERLVFEARRGGQHRISPESAAAGHAQFDELLRDGDLIQEVVLPHMSLVQSCCQLILRRTAKHGFRTYDCFHVSSALALNCDTFWSFDKQAIQLAQLEGLKTN